MDVLSPCSTPRRSKKSGRDSNNNKNPYANRGLDKFSALLADLEGKKQKIYTQVGAEDISIVRFVFPANSDDVKPIVVKFKGKKESAGRDENHAAKTGGSPEKVEVEKRVMQSSSNDQKEEKKLSKSVSWKVDMKWEDLKKPRFYMPLTIVLILVFLAIYGRTFAILCTSIGWYVIPTIKGKNSSSSSSFNSRNKPQRKKEYTRRFSEKNISTPKRDGSTSPKSVLTGHHAHRKSF
ncbi:PREDICTED: uncharacterized protein LOC109169793 [Ipomoea nil]|uniref:uncharacterized protein LOC109169793 n=1 Tax=Ipomoea nil TaxID=35883 RepID=UPI00090186E6|nr:PREDICTED: uncharacterized protein LOC109169793 [Ipomoea nil]